MNTKNEFPLSLDFEGRHFEGVVTPSGETDENGLPVYYRVVIGKTLFAYLCCGDKGWFDREAGSQTPGLVNKIGDYIQAHYS